jgi:2-polyprenyl-6-methoxyphenol hydroxylase-like FAD-dependent oxidoreductase
MAKIGEHAVVLGASMGGLMAARVLADFYEAVTVVERDVLPQGAANRRGVPQGRHAHAILGKGLEVLGEFFPGFTDDLVAAGIPVLDYQDMGEHYTCFAGHPSPRTGSFKNVAPLFMPSRPMLEGLVRQRLRAIDNVLLRDGHEVVALTSRDDGSTVTGARICDLDGDQEEQLCADLVVDATGRAGRTPALLEVLGYGRPPEQQVRVRLTYASQTLRIPPGVLHEKIVLISPIPGRPTGMALLGYENDVWMLTAFGMAGCVPPAAFADMIPFLSNFAPDHVVEALRQAEPIGEVVHFRYPESRWRRYDRLRRFPDGLVVLGDAICSFNPTYGQGMTVAMLQAQALGRCLQQDRNDLARRYFRAAAKPIGVAWQFAVGGDLNLPEVEGHRSVAMRITNKYVGRLQQVAENDIEIAELFTRVVGFLDPPAKLFGPKPLMRAARHRPRSATPRQAAALSHAE